MWKNWNSLTLLVGMQNRYTSLGNSLEVSDKVKYTPILPASNFNHIYLPKGSESTCSQKEE